MWIEIKFSGTRLSPITSRLARALWIEISKFRGWREINGVEARESLVDRNRRRSRDIKCRTRSRLARALWIEIVSSYISSLHHQVEARESLVDRNYLEGIHLVIYPRRGSREPCGSKFLRSCSLTLSSGRGSREPCGSKFHILHSRFLEDGVEARESLVDRNPAVPAPQSLSACRGSREPCGSKFPNHRHNLHRLLSRLARALWIEMSSAVPGRPSALSRLSRALWI